MRGVGVKNRKKYADVLCGRPLGQTEDPRISILHIEILGFSGQTHWIIKLISIPYLLGPQQANVVLSICLSTLYAILFVVGFFGNLLTALIIIFNSYMRVPPNFFLLSLAVADMITLLGGKKLYIFDSIQTNRIVHFKHVSSGHLTSYFQVTSLSQ